MLFLKYDIIFWHRLRQTENSKVKKEKIVVLASHQPINITRRHREINPTVKYHHIPHFFFHTFAHSHFIFLFTMAKGFAFNFLMNFRRNFFYYSLNIFFFKGILASE
jgi:hypothetical protein